MGGIEEVGYYYLYNGTVGTYIWPQLRHGDDIGRNIWNGRDYSGYGLNVEQSVMVNLLATGISGTFWMACDTQWGIDKTCGEQQFRYVPGSNRVACGRANGGARNGGIDYQGIKTRSQLLEENPDVEIIPIVIDDIDSGSVRLEPANVRGSEDISSPEDISQAKLPYIEPVGVAA